MDFFKKMAILIVMIMFTYECSEAKSVIVCNFDFGLKEISLGNVLNKKTITKEFINNGIKIKYHINNTNKFSELDDYVTMENEQGQKMTYSLKCN